MSTVATNRSAALAGACSAVGMFVCSAVADQLLPSHEVARWWVNLLVLGIIFFVPFFKWVIGTDFKADGQWYSLREQWLALPQKYSRMGIWFMSACAVGVVLSLVTRGLFK
jgi:hypothetical protein